jgi:FixJ family two-component response regulator
MEIQQAMNDKRTEVLLVDDESDSYTMIRNIVALIPTMEINVDQVAANEEAIVAMEQNRYDIYLVVCHRDSRSGLELLRDAIDRGCARPVFILGDHVDYDIDVQASKIGASGYFDKEHLDSVLFERSIRYALRGVRTPASGSSTNARPGDLQLQIALARGATVRDAANAAGVAERTAHRRLGDPLFRAEVDQLRHELRVKIVENVAAQLANDHFNDSGSEASSVVWVASEDLDEHPNARG